MVTHEDALATVKHQILDAWASTIYLSDPSAQIDAILKNILSPHTRWAIKMLIDRKQAEEESADRFFDEEYD